MSRRIAAVGEPDFTAGFELAGVTETRNPDDFGEEMDDLLEREDLGILVVKDQRLDELNPRLESRVRDSVEPVVVGLSEEPSTEKLSERIRKAIGAEVG